MRAAIAADGGMVDEDPSDDCCAIAAAKRSKEGSWSSYYNSKRCIHGGACKAKQLSRFQTVKELAGSKKDMDFQNAEENYATIIRMAK